MYIKSAFQVRFFIFLLCAAIKIRIQTREVVVIAKIVPTGMDF